MSSLLARVAVQRVTPSKATAQEHEEAATRHRDDRAVLVETVKDMAGSPDVTTSNTARWFLTGRSRLFALTPTADATDRASVAGKPGELAMFGGTRSVLESEAATYATADLEANEGVRFVPRDSGGFRLPRGGEVFVTQPARRDHLNQFRKAAGLGRFDPLPETLRHETQHEADVAYNVDFVEARDAADRAMATYRTEFRAYTAERPSWLADKINADEEDTLAGHVWPGGDVQKRVFLQIHDHYADVKGAWSRNELLRSGKTFREEVVAMHGGIRAISLNPTNSPEVDALWKLLTSDRVQPENASTLVAAAKAVTPDDRAVMLGSEDVWSRWITKSWQRHEVRVLLSGRFEEFGRARTERLATKRAAAEAEARKRAPDWDVLSKRFSSWEDVKALITEAKLGDSEMIKDELADWSDKWNKDHAEAFFGNTHGPWGVDWWTVAKL